MSHVRYRLTGTSFPGTVDLTVWADGRARLEHARAGGVRAWTAELDQAVWPWLLDTLRSAGFPHVAAPTPLPGSTLRELTVDGGLGGSLLFGWRDGGELGLGPALRILDALVYQVGDGAVRETANEVPRLAHRSAPDPALPPLDPGSPAAAAFGTVGGRPAYALSRPGRTFSLYGLPYGEDLGSATVTDAPTRAVALGTAGGREIVATGGDDLIIRVWDTGTGQQLHATTGHGGPVPALAASGGLIYTGGADGVLRVWDAAGSLGELAERHEGAINAVCVDGTLLVTGSDDGAVRLTDLSDGRTLHSLPGHTGWVNAVAAADGLVASAGSDRLIRVWDAATGQELRALEGHEASVTGLTFLSVAGRPALASCALDGRVTVHDPHTGILLSTWRSGEWAAAIGTAPKPPAPTEPAAPEGPATTATREGRATAGGGGVPEWLVTAGDGVRVWAADGTLSRELTGVAADAVATDGALVAAGSPGGTLWFWRLADGDQLPEASTAAASGDGGVTSLAFDGGGLVCGTGSGTVRVHHPVDGVVAVPTPHTGQVLALALDGDLLVSGGMDGTVRTWDAVSGRPLRRLLGHTAGVTCLATGRVGGRVVIASSGYDRAVRTWDAATGRPLSVVHGHPLPVYALAFGTVGGRAVLAAGSYDGLVPVRDAETGENVVVLGGNPGTVRCLRFHGPDVLAVGCDDGTVRLWRLPDGERVGETRLGDVPLALSSDLYAVTHNGLSRLTPPESQ
ncbi:WD40 repeat domain-containing protein [Nonomuraea aurantiaca]|uniref:WD40 repeat domain-containing protein n=1 Tax=Nonomuraea aurantiaca TaxID=2878562 RepID=UPI001CD91AB3|nr:WD40 repeat domain-containing protein [Nonomuraea aurantiaca]MCA2224286.1 WD40 repeat domain-containing protein [Nonomuraea aurantiaca]